MYDSPRNRDCDYILTFLDFSLGLYFLLFIVSSLNLFFLTYFHEVWIVLLSTFCLFVCLFCFILVLPACTQLSSYSFEQGHNSGYHWRFMISHRIVTFNCLSLLQKNKNLGCPYPSPWSVDETVFMQVLCR